MSSNLIPGGWTPYRKPTAEEIALFNKVMEQIKGVRYVPTEVSSQVVAGTNYRFRADGTISNLEQTKIKVLIEIFEPLPGEGKTHLVSISPV